LERGKGKRKNYVPNNRRDLGQKKHLGEHAQDLCLWAVKDLGRDLYSVSQRKT